MSPSYLEQVVKEHSQQISRLETLLANFVQTTQSAILELKLEMKEFKEEMKVFKDGMETFKLEMKDFKDEMLEFKNEMKGFKDEMRVFKDGVEDFKLEMKDFKDEMLEFKNEMKAFKDEMLEFKNEMKGFKDEMLKFKNEVRAFIEEMKEFKEEMIAFKEEMRAFKRESQKQWGELANRLGTFAEDIAAPNILRIAREHARNEELVYYAVRIRKKNPQVRGAMREVDAIVEYETFVCVNETKTSPRKQDIDAFKRFVESGEFQKYFPDYKNKRVIPIFASLYMEPSLINYATKKKVLVFAMGEDTMDIQNTELLPLYFFN
jgi:chromosome segregation ATPase